MFSAYRYMQNQLRIEIWASKTIFVTAFESKMAAKSKMAADKLIYIYVLNTILHRKANKYPIIHDTYFTIFFICKIVL